MAKINEIIQEVTSIEKVAHTEERIAIDELISELEKVAGEGMWLMPKVTLSQETE